MITSELTRMVCDQDMDLSRLNRVLVMTKKYEIKAEKENRLKESFNELLEEMNEKTKRRVLCAREKGASSWFSSLPLKKYGYAINKQEISNGICVRCSWSIQNRPIFCACGTRNNVDHILT